MSDVITEVVSGPSRQPHRTGRPSAYSEEIAEEICERLAVDGLSLTKIVADPALPSYRTVMRWLDEQPAFCQMYARARAIQLDIKAEETIDIADDATNDVTIDSEGNPRVDSENIQRSRLRVDARKWFAAKLNPRKYGDKTLHVGGDGEGPIQHALALDYSALSDDELLQLRTLLAKASGGAVEPDPLQIEGMAETPSAITDGE